MMTQRNVELQLQALEHIEQKNGVRPPLFILSKQEPNTSNKDIDQSQHSSPDIKEDIMEEVNR